MFTIRDPANETAARVAEIGALRTTGCDNDYLTRVNHQGRLCAISTAKTAPTLTSTGNDGCKMFIRNEDLQGNQLWVSGIVISNNTAGTIARLDIGSGLASAANANVPDFAVLRSDKAAPTNIYARVWDEVGDGITTMSGGFTVWSLGLPVGVTAVSLPSPIILAQSGSLAVFTKGAAEISISAFLAWLKDDEADLLGT